jgi:hypothetical protein
MSAKLRSPQSRDVCADSRFRCSDNKDSPSARHLRHWLTWQKNAGPQGIPATDLPSQNGGQNRKYGMPGSRVSKFFTHDRIRRIQSRRSGNAR